MEKTGLYDPSYEHDACGLAFVSATAPSHRVVQLGLEALFNLDHRGAVGAEENSGDGAGILIQTPDSFFRTIIPGLPPAGHYAAGLVFLPGAAAGPQAQSAAVAGIEKIAREEGLRVLSWRTVPIDDHMIGPTARASMPSFRHLIVVDEKSQLSGIDLDRKAYRLRRRAANETGVYMASLATKTLVYKGMLTTTQLPEFFPDLVDPRLETAIAMVHSRFSTNTFPSWPLAQPFRMIAHNGEINTVRGNRNWMGARESVLAHEALGNISDLLPICSADMSDSASLDEVLELLVLSGRSLPHALAMLVPQAWENDETLDPKLRDFYQYHSLLIEPWDGPANVSFTDGTIIGATMDRNGLRPGRWLQTSDGMVVLASEAGVVSIDESTIVAKGRLEPGTMFVVDTSTGRIIPDAQVKSELASQAPYGSWLKEHTVDIKNLPQRDHVDHSRSSVLRRQQTFGYTQEENERVIAPMGQMGAEAIGSMGTDTPIAVLSSRPRLLFDYFSQLFAQVTNPPLDAIREVLVTSLQTAIGPEPNLLEESAEHAKKLMLPFPVIDNDQLAKILHIGKARAGKGFKAVSVSALYRYAGGAQALEERLDELCATVDAAIDEGASFVVISDRESNAEFAPIPSLLVTSAIHHHLLRNKTRTRVSLVVEAGDVREVHHVALLIGYGAAAVNPYLAMETVEDLSRHGVLGDVSPDKAVDNLIHALGKGVLKVMSKMGISTLQSYCGAQVFQATGLDPEFVDRYFSGTPTPIAGVGLETIAAEVQARHEVAYPRSGIPATHRTLPTGGEYHWRREGEEHLFDPETVARLQTATRSGKMDIFRRYTAAIDDQSKRLMTLRGLLEFRDVAPVPLEEVEPVEEIVKRFATGAMSYGSISREAHELLALAMNQLGGKSNTGEGGEVPERLRDPKRCSAIKQVASARFGVTAEYLTSAQDIQIKMAQGAKPGEGGQLPSHKVYPWVAKARHSTPGVGLISPPPHHDIYSIEDLAQLIFDLKNANPQARVHVKLVSEVGVGTVAAGVAKAHADVVLISGHDGGTGAAPLTSVKHAGAPWEVGVAEAQQTLVLNSLRDRVVVQTDGQLKTGRDVVIAALLGAEEFGFATAPLVVSGCIMMRKCHLDTCPVGVATQNPILRQRFAGRVEHIINFFTFIATEVRELLAQLGLRSIDEAIGRVDLLDTRQAIDHWKAQGLDLTPVLTKIEPQPGAALRNTTEQNHHLDEVIDHRIISQAKPALDNGEPVTIEMDIRNTDRSIGTMTGHEVAKRYGDDGLAAHTITVNLRGSAGQSLGAFLPQGISLHLRGEANDYLGKSLCGGTISIAAPPDVRFEPSDNVIAGNVIGYGATSGTMFIAGRVGERCAVRNSGATLVVEGTGDHACEYMTGGNVLVLGRTGRNIGAGMSGGQAFFLDLDHAKLNSEVNRMCIVRPINDAEADQVHTMLRDHVEATDSAYARALLDNFDSQRHRYSIIMPKQWDAVRAILAEAKENNVHDDDPQLWNRILEVS